MCGMKAGGASGNGKKRLRDDSVSCLKSPDVFNREAIKDKQSGSEALKLP